MPGYWPSAFGAATKVRIGEPGRAMSTYSVLTIICLFARNSDGGSRASQLPDYRPPQEYLDHPSVSSPTQKFLQFLDLRFGQVHILLGASYVFFSHRGLGLA